MKCPSFEAVRSHKMEKCSAVAGAALKAPQPKTSPVKPCPSLLSLNDNTRPVHNKENDIREHNKTLDETLLGNEALEDSGYLSLHNSQISDPHEEEGHGLQLSLPAPSSPATYREKATTLTSFIHPMSTPKIPPVEVSPVSLTPIAVNLSHPNLPIMKFQRAVYEELDKDFKKNKRYDWSIVDKLAENYPLDKVIGRHMGLEYVDVFSSLLFRNMKCILTHILALLNDMDLISCKAVSRTWRSIIFEDKAALSRCLQAEQTLIEWRNSSHKENQSLTRDTALSRVVLSCIQTMASTTPSAANRRTALSKKDQTPHAEDAKNAHFHKYLEAASNLKRDESLCSCRRCGSPAKYSAETQRATCTRPACLFDFCTCCRETYHGASPCRVLRSRSSKTTPVIPGSARSKRNVRRL